MSCQLEVVETTGPLGKVNGEELTVGRPFLLHCEGEWPDLAADKLELRLDPADNYKLKLLRFEKKSGAQADLMVTSYKAGDHQLKAVQLVDPDHSVLLGDLQFSVKSVLDPKEPQQEPFGPMGPIVFGVPLWFWLVGALILSFLGGVIWFRVAKRSRMRKWLLEMKLYEKVLSPMAELGKALRNLQKNFDRGVDFAKDLQLAYMVYLARIFEIPTVKMTRAQILSSIKAKNRKLFDEHSEEMTRTIEELERAISTQSNLSLKDLEQLLHLVRRSGEEIERISGGGKTG